MPLTHEEWKRGEEGAFGVMGTITVVARPAVVVVDAYPLPLVLQQPPSVHRPVSLRVVRAELFLSQSALASVAGITRKVIWRLEHGHAVLYETAVRVLKTINSIRNDYGYRRFCLHEFEWSIPDLPGSFPPPCVGFCQTPSFTPPRAQDIHDLRTLRLFLGVSASQLAAQASPPLSPKTIYKAGQHKYPISRKTALCICDGLNRLLHAQGKGEVSLADLDLLIAPDS